MKNETGQRLCLDILTLSSVSDKILELVKEFETPNAPDEPDPAVWGLLKLRNWIIDEMEIEEDYYLRFEDNEWQDYQNGIGSPRKLDKYKENE